MVQWQEGSPPTNVPGVQFWPVGIRGSSFLLVLALLPGFFPGSLVFLPLQKPRNPNSNPTRKEDLHENQLRLMWLPLKYCN